MPLSESQEEELVVGMRDRGVLGFYEAGTILSSGRESPYYYNSRFALSTNMNLDRSGVMTEDAQFYLQNLLIEGYAQKMLEIETRVDHVFARAQAATALAACATKSACMSFLWERVGSEKSYGSHSAIEGDYQLYDKVLITDDTITSGSSMLGGIKILHNANLLPLAATVQFDREEGGVQGLQRLGLEVNAVTGLTKAVRFLKANNRITNKELDALQDYHQALRDRGEPTTFTVDS